jgi:hypothetical protein
MSRYIIRAISIVVPCLTLVIGLVFTQPLLQTEAASFMSNHLVSTAQITCGQWNRIPNSTKNAALEGVASISLSDAWAVGFMDIASNPINSQPFTMHWNGIRWKSILSPTLSGNSHILHAVAAISTSDVWAVGEGSSSGSQALMEHWDGTSWSEVTAPSAGVASVLYSIVSVPGTNELWAVGYYSSNNSNYALLEHWDGTQWTVFPSPSIPSNNAGLQSVTAFSSTNVWAVGWFTSPTGGEQTLIEQWDGTSWTVVPSPNTSSDNVLFSIAPVPNTAELWAVGTDGGSGKYDKTLIEHWDGSTWSVVPSANLRGSNFLLGSMAVATNDVWSVGTDSAKALMEHWDGVQWSIVSQPASTISKSSLWSIAGVPNQPYIWAVGFFYTTSTQMYHPLTMLYC